MISIYVIDILREKDDIIDGLNHSPGKKNQGEISECLEKSRKNFN